MKPVAWMFLPWPNNGLNPVVTLSPNREPSLYGAAVPLYAQSDDGPLLRQALEALEYHVEQTRPIHQTSETIAALRERLGETDKT